MLFLENCFLSGKGHPHHKLYTKEKKCLNYSVNWLTTSLQCVTTTKKKINNKNMSSKNERISNLSHLGKTREKLFAWSDYVVIELFCFFFKVLKKSCQRDINKFYLFSISYFPSFSTLHKSFDPKIVW